jgi:hypothetical protein
MIKRRILTRICLEQQILSPEEMDYLNEFINWTSTTGREYYIDELLWRKRDNLNDVADWLQLHDEFFFSVLPAILAQS